MTAAPAKNLFWDSCILIRYLLKDVSAPFYQDICTYVEEAKAGKWRIHFSTVTYAEIRQEFFKPSYGKIEDFFSDLGSNFIPIDMTPNILIRVGELRSANSTNPAPNSTPSKRAIATPDAIVMVSCLFAKLYMGMPDIILHSTDEGRGKGWAGRAVPVIGFENWYPQSTRTPMVSSICALSRELPSHPSPPLPGTVIHGKFPATQSGTSAGPTG